MDIDKKLRDLELEFLHGVPVHLNDVMTGQIRQVFLDMAYVSKVDIDKSLLPPLNGLAVECAFGVIDREDMPKLVDDALKQIKQAFIESGWTPPKYNTRSEPRKPGDDMWGKDK